MTRSGGSDVTDNRILAYGLLINSALYLVGCFVVGLLQNPIAWKLALASMAITYLSYYSQLAHGVSRYVQIALCSASIITGAAAGLVLLG